MKLMVILPKSYLSTDHSSKQNNSNHHKLSEIGILSFYKIQNPCDVKESPMHMPVLKTLALILRWELPIMCTFRKNACFEVHLRFCQQQQVCVCVCMCMIYRLLTCSSHGKPCGTGIKSEVHYSEVIMSAMASQITGISTVYSLFCSGVDQSSTSQAFVRGIHRWLVNSLHKRPVTRKMFSFDEVNMITHQHTV